MKRLTILIGAILVSCLVLFGVRKNFETATAGSPETIIVYNWGDYIDPELIAQFEEETGYKVIYETFDSNEAMLTKIKQGGTNYDVAIPSEYTIHKMVQENQIIRKSKASNTLIHVSFISLLTRIIRIVFLISGEL